MWVVEVGDVLFCADDRAHGGDVEAEEHAPYCGDYGEEVGVVGFGEAHDDGGLE